MSYFIPQCKGTDSDTMPTLKSWWSKGVKWLWSIKYDGQYAQIHILDNEVIFYTSSGKPYKNTLLEEELLKRIPKAVRPVILEAEYLGTGEGLLGGRSDAAVVTTLRTNYTKGITQGMAHKIRIFDIIEDETFAVRLADLQNIYHWFEGSELIQVVEYFECETLEDAKVMSAKMVNAGYEGIYCKSICHVQAPGKRVKTAFKFKAKHTTTVTIIDVDEGTGKYAGQIGAFICEDANGMRVSVGSGLVDSIRAMAPQEVLGKTIRINYERIDKTYIFPIFLGFQD